MKLSEDRRPRRKLFAVMGLAAVCGAGVHLSGCGEGDDQAETRGGSSGQVSVAASTDTEAEARQSSYVMAAPNDGPSADVEYGRVRYLESCASCHGATAVGLPHQGTNLAASPFVASHTDQELVNFLKVGRQPNDPKSVMGLLMPPKGGNPALNDLQLAQIVAYLRVVQKEAAAEDDESAAAPQPRGASPGLAVSTAAVR